MKLAIGILMACVLSSGMLYGDNSVSKPASATPNIDFASATIQFPDPTSIDADLHNGGATVLKDLHGTYEILDDRGHSVQEGQTASMYIAPGGDVVYPVPNNISGFVDGQFLLRFKLTDSKGHFYELHRPISIFHQ